MAPTVTPNQGCGIAPDAQNPAAVTGVVVMTATTNEHGDVLTTAMACYRSYYRA
jgi:hypothetical protein